RQRRQLSQSQNGRDIPTSAAIKSMRMTLPDYVTRFDSLSLSACFLDLKGVGDLPRQATGFFWRCSQKAFLITNWHVVTGLNMMDGSTIGNHWVPEHIVLR